jgi:hypothetical protein
LLGFGKLVSRPRSYSAYLAARLNESGDRSIGLAIPVFLHRDPSLLTNKVLQFGQI